MDSQGKMWKKKKKKTIWILFHFPLKKKKQQNNKQKTPNRCNNKKGREDYGNSHEFIY